MPGKHGMSNHFRNVILGFHKQVPLFNIRERRKQARLDPRLLTLKLRKEPLDLPPLPVRVAARRAGTAGDRKTRQRRVADDIVLRHVHERPDHDISSVISPEQGGHRLDLAVIELIEQQRLDEVVAVMTKGDLRAAQFRCPRVKYTAPDPRAEGTGGIARPELFQYHLMDRGADDMMLKPLLPEIGSDPVNSEPGEPRMHGHCCKGKTHRRPLSEALQNMQQGPAVLAARKGDQDAIAVLDEPEVSDGAADKPPNTALQHLTPLFHCFHIINCRRESKYFCLLNNKKAPVLMSGGFLETLWSEDFLSLLSLLGGLFFLLCRFLLSGFFLAFFAAFFFTAFFFAFFLAFFPAGFFFTANAPVEKMDSSSCWALASDASTPQQNTGSSYTPPLLVTSIFLPPPLPSYCPSRSISIQISLL